MEELAVIVLAGGRGKRMLSDQPKVTFSTRERPLIQHVLTTAQALSPKKIVVVTGYRREVVEEVVARGASETTYSNDNIAFGFQKEQLGTGDAVKAALPALEGFTGTVVILYGDVPLTTVETLRDLLKRHHEDKATVTVLTLKTNTPNAYGRIVRDPTGRFIERVVEAKDCTNEEANITEFNSGIYAVESAFLAPAIEGLKNDNAQKEYYLTDIVAAAVKEGQTVSSVVITDDDEVQGVNTLVDLASVNTALHQRSISALLMKGVRVEDPRTLYVEPSVRVEPGAVIGPNVQLRGKTIIEKGVVLEGSAYLENVTVKEGALIKFGVRGEDAVIGPKAQVGPFAHLRPGSELGEDARMGNFVETKNAKLGKHAKASHLTYLGDCEVGENTNIGAGTITCNYDGYRKSRTVIGKNAFIGSDTALVAPVTIGDGAIIGAGSVITKNVEADALALTRPEMRVKAGWAKARREREEKK